MNSEYRVAELVPHAGVMSLLSRVVDYGDDWLRAEVDIGPDSTFADENGVPAWIGLEYMAQTIAAYAGLQQRRQGNAPKIGFLLGTRNYSASADYFAPGETLSVMAQEEVVGDNGLNVFKCELRGNQVSASAVINVFQPDNADVFLAGALA